MIPNISFEVFIEDDVNGKPIGEIILDSSIFPIQEEIYFIPGIKVVDKAPKQVIFLTKRPDNNKGIN